jgi:glycosyltransferase involved in cell wall biosynthesis
MAGCMAHRDVHPALKGLPWREMEWVAHGMRIGIDGKVISSQAGGIGTSAFNLVRSCLREAEKCYPQMAFVIFTGPQTCLQGIHGGNWRADERFRSVESSFLRLLFHIPRGLRAQHIDVFHGLDHIGVPLFRKVGRYVATIHDLIPLLWPQFVTRRHRLVVAAACRRLRHQADLVIVPSEATKADVVHQLQMNPERIVVIPWGCDERFQPRRDLDRFAVIQRKYHLPARYLLFVGTLEPRKNLITLLKAYAILRAERLDHDVKLVVVGRKGWLYEEIFATVKRLALHADVLFTDFVADEDLPELYRGALLLVFPSLYEGFGLPILEAMASGIPVIASNTSSMPEVAGEAALLIDPRTPEAIAEGMAQILADDQLRKTLTQKGLARAQCFTWERVAQQTLALYAALA